MFAYRVDFLNVCPTGQEQAIHRQLVFERDARNRPDEQTRRPSGQAKTDQIGRAALSQQGCQLGAAVQTARARQGMLCGDDRNGIKAEDRILRHDDASPNQVFAEQRQQGLGHATGTLARANDEGVVVEGEVRRLAADPDAESVCLPGKTVSDESPRIDGRNCGRKKSDKRGTRRGCGQRWTMIPS